MIIIGSGPSAANFTPPTSAEVMAINGAIDRHPNADYFFTLDPSPINLERLKRESNCKKFLAYDSTKFVREPWHYKFTFLCRLSNDLNTTQEPPRENASDWWFWRWGCKGGLSESPVSVHTGNSMYGGLNLAFNMIRLRSSGNMKRKILLVGLDGTREPRLLEGGEPNCLLHLPKLFKSAVYDLRANGFEVVNANPDSMIDCFPRVTHSEGVRWYLS